MLKFDTLSRIESPSGIPNTWNPLSLSGDNIFSNGLKIGKTVQDEHTKPICTKYETYNPRNLDDRFRRSINTNLSGRKKCVKVEQKGNFKTGSVPLGAWAEVYDGTCFASSPLYKIYKPGPTQISNDVSIECSGETTNSDCYITNKYDETKTGKDNCLTSGIQYPVYCQLGDFIHTNQDCADQCSGAKSTDKQEEHSYCHFALDKLCGKLPGDIIKRNQYGENVKSDKAWIIQDQCTNYCGGPEDESSDTCYQHKVNYCSNPNSFPEAEDYCRKFWTNKPNYDQFIKGCEAKLLDPEGPENITKDNGCGKLCNGIGKDFNTEYCNQIRSRYCATKDNIFSKYCYDFCKSNPEMCSFIIDKCQDKQDQLNLPIPNTKLHYRNICGCLMDQSFYDNYKSNINENLKKQGYGIKQEDTTINDPSLTKAECIYPYCDSDAIMTTHQMKNKPSCNSNCLNFVYKNFSELQDSDIKKCQAITTLFDLEVDNPSSKDTSIPPPPPPPPPPPDPKDNDNNDNDNSNTTTNGNTTVTKDKETSVIVGDSLLEQNDSIVSDTKNKIEHEDKRETTIDEPDYSEPTITTESSKTEFDIVQFFTDYWWQILLGVGIIIVLIVIGLVIKAWRS